MGCNRLGKFIFAVLLPIWWIFAEATHVVLDPHERRCFNAHAYSGDRILCSAQAIPPNLDLDAQLFKLRNITSPPSGPFVVKAENGSLDYTVEVAGYYGFCLKNPVATPTSVIFTFRVDSMGTGNLSDLTTVEDAQDVLKFAERLLENTHVIMDQMEAYSARENLYTKIISHMNTRIITWSIIQMLFVIGVCCFQIYYISSFFEVKSFV